MNSVFGSVVYWIGIGLTIAFGLSVGHWFFQMVLRPLLGW